MRIIQQKYLFCNVEKHFEGAFGRMICIENTRSDSIGLIGNENIEREERAEYVMVFGGMLFRLNCAARHRP